MNKQIKALHILAGSLLLAVSVSSAQEGNSGAEPYLAPVEYPDNVYFGDAHVHTSLSLDAAAWGSSILPDDAYRYARGEEVPSFKGWKSTLTRPLDWLVIADHSDGYDFTNRVAAGDPWIIKDELVRRWYELLQTGGEAERRIVADEIVKGF
mgnify:FL=1